MRALAETRWEFTAIGTRWRIDTAAPLAESARAAVTEVIAAFDRDWSRFRTDSLVSALATHGGDAPAPPDAEEMLSLYAELSLATDGAINPLVGDSLSALGYDRSLSLRPGSPTRAPDRWRDVLRFGNGRLALTQPATIDVGALGKGRLVDLVHDTLVSLNEDGFAVDGGGDIRLRGRSEHIGLEHPYDPRRVVGVVQMTDGALCASATNRRAWGDGLHHVLDARSGMPVHTIAATWAMAPTAMRADAIATALFFDGGPELAHRWGVEWVRMRTDGVIQWSPGSRAELFS